ncbi:peptidylprolyl isomerase [Caldimonas tepidiphila]|uniref:peptidylprolyl isomerase n=1 Tax=Caldimonas tepidiphila TaxID=2315841 RepID=UPI000E5B787E|nr:peptidylprolyl isomerase [Caldimonas tepidiphila]
MNSLFDSRRASRRVAAAAALLAAFALPAAPVAAQGAAGSRAAAASAPRTADFIVAVVGQELVTNAEVQQRIARARQEAARSGQRLPPPEELRREVLEALIDERAQLAHARESGVRVDEAEIDRAVAAVAAQNQLTPAELRERLRKEGLDYARFRANLRDELLLQRVREREVQARIRVSEQEIDRFLAEQRGGAAPAASYNIAQVLVAVPEGASEAEVAQRRERAEQALAQARAGQPFEQLVQRFSDGAKEQGGELGLRPADRLPELFVQAVKGLQPGQLAPQLLRSGAGFHVLKLVERREGALTVTQNRARHILLRLSPQRNQSAALRQLADMRRRLLAGTASFESLARQHSEDGSAAQGGDLGWAGPGQFVPEFERVLETLQPGGLSEPFVSRFGAHLVQLEARRELQIEPRQQREMARNALRAQKSEAAYEDWAREVRERAYIELREDPQ